MCTCVFEESVRAEAHSVGQVRRELFRFEPQTLVVTIRRLLNNMNRNSYNGVVEEGPMRFVFVYPCVCLCYRGPLAVAVAAPWLRLQDE